MSFIGDSPKAKRVRFTPQSADPSNPQEGDVFYSDGTPRGEGLWQYINGDWEAVANQPLNYEDFVPKEYIEVRAATTVNISIATELENGDSLDGVTLATGDLVLVKNQTTSSENGVYVVALSGAASRYSGADTAEELSRAAVYIREGTTQKRTRYFQQNELSALSDPQSWLTTPASYSWTVPTNVTQIIVWGAGGGGGGGSGYGTSPSTDRGGGGGGAGALPQMHAISTVPGNTLTINVGEGGLGGYVSSGTGVAGNNGNDTTISGIGPDGAFTLTLAGAPAGRGGGESGVLPTSGLGGPGGGTAAVPGTTLAVPFNNYTFGGFGGGAAASAHKRTTAGSYTASGSDYPDPMALIRGFFAISGRNGQAGQSSQWAAGGGGGVAETVAGAGGGGGAGFGAGAEGGRSQVGAALLRNGSNAAAGSSAGGGGGGANGSDILGGRGGSGRVRIIW